MTISLLYHLTDLCDILPMEHVDGLVEMIRVFGNLTHSKEVRNILVEKEGNNIYYCVFRIYSFRFRTIEINLFELFLRCSQTL